MLMNRFTKAEIPPIADDEEPAAQSEHMEAPEKALYAPLPHDVQVAAVVAPVAVDDVPCKQNEHMVEPVLAWKEPAEQLAHADEPSDGV